MKKNIAVITGGYSSEYEISILSAETVFKHLDLSKYEPYIIIITDSTWVLKRDNQEDIAVNKNDFTCSISGNIIHFDCAFIIVHGTPGEDGKLQGYLDMLKIPYTTSGLLTSSLTFDKHACKTYLHSLGTRMAESRMLKMGERYSEKEILSKTGIPCFVKPNSAGSSHGISKVNDIRELKNAIEIAFKEDDTILIEEFIDGREITCGVIKEKGNLKALAITEITTENDFFDYEAKYTEGMANETTPADISEQLESECKDLSINLYKQLNCSGIVRFDYIVSNGELFFLEVNTIPGLTDKSLIPQQANHAGISLKDLFSICIEEALTNQ